LLYDVFKEFTDTLFIKAKADDSKVLELISGQENVFEFNEVRNKNIVFEAFEEAGDPIHFRYIIKKENVIINDDAILFNQNTTAIFPQESGLSLEVGTYTISLEPLNIDITRIPMIEAKWSFTIVDSNDADGDGIQNEIDLCPDTPTGESVNAFGCSVSQLADLAVQNIGLSIGSDPCVESSGFAEISVLQNVPLDVEIFKDGASFYTGSITLATPLDLTDLAFGAYEICVSNDTALGYEQCFDVSYSALSNSVSTNIIIQNPGQTYTMQVAGSTSYTVPKPKKLKFL